MFHAGEQKERKRQTDHTDTAKLHIALSDFANRLKSELMLKNSSDMRTFPNLFKKGILKTRPEELKQTVTNVVTYHYARKYLLHGAESFLRS